MYPQQATIRIERGRIQSIEPSLGYVRIVNELGAIDYPGAWVMPGLVDAHIHLQGLGAYLTGLNLSSCTSARDCAQRSFAFRNIRSDGWLTGFGWNESKWLDQAPPHRLILDSLFPETAVLLSRSDGHAVWANTLAMTRAGITRDWSAPAGHEVLRDADGTPCGLFQDESAQALRSAVPALDDSIVSDQILAASRHCLSLGITEVHDMDVDPTFLDVFRSLAERGVLPMRVQSYVRSQHNEWMSAGLLPAGGEFFRLCGVKYFMDGALGSRGAALLQPYEDMPQTSGTLFLTADALYHMAQKALEYDWQMAVHAIGDAACREAISAFKRLRRDPAAAEDAIIRLEHAQHLDPEDINALADLSIIVSVQPHHCLSDAKMAESRLGLERCRNAFAWRSLRNSGLSLSAGSDAPVDELNPFRGIDAFVRRTPAGASVPWFSSQCITRAEALLAYTVWAHTAAGMEYRRGQLKTKFDADLVVVDRDIIHCPEEMIAETNVLATYTAGIVRYSREFQ